MDKKRKFRLRVSTNKVGSHCETIQEFDPRDVPEDWEMDRQFNQDMLDILFDTGLVSWDAEEITE